MSDEFDVLCIYLRLVFDAFERAFEIELLEFLIETLCQFNLTLNLVKHLFVRIFQTLHSEKQLLYAIHLHWIEVLLVRVFSQSSLNKLFVKRALKIGAGVMYIFTLSKVFEILVFGCILYIGRIAIKEDTFEYIFNSLRAAYLTKMLNNQSDLVLIDIVLASQ